MKKTKLASTAITLCIALSGCTSVQPWERGRLAKTEMSFEPDPMCAAFQRHVHSSKEASTGGSTTAGGGCGCN